MDTNHEDPLFFFRVLSIIAFFGVLLTGVYLAKNYQKLSGVDPNMPSENSSSRAYTKLQVFLIWAHALLLTGMLSLLLH